MTRAKSSQSRPAGPRRYIVALAAMAALSAACLLLASCPGIGPDPDPETTFLALDDLSPEMADLVDSLDSRINDHLYGYALSYNRVISLTNSVLLADMQKTSRQILAQRSASALAEIDDLLQKCRAMEAFAVQELEPALDDFAAKHPRQVAALSARKPGNPKGDEWRARRLIEMMLDFSYEANFDLEKISRSTGVGMAKLKFLMDQTNQQFQTEVDIVDYQELDKEIARIETIRDTANTVNSALSLVNPVQAVIKGGATATGAAAVGWLAKTKTAVTVVENGSAVLSFTSGVVNIAVAQEDIPPAFKAVSKANDYLGIILSGKQGFTGTNWGEKTVGIIGTGTGTVTAYFEVKDGGVDVSNSKILPGTPAEINPPTESSLGGLLPEGFYNIPDVELEDWDFPEFDWGGAEKEQFWIDMYEGSATQAAVDEMVGVFEAFAADWDPKPNSGMTKEVQASSDQGMPGFFDDPDGDFPDPGEVGDEPAQEDFSVVLSASRLAGPLPLTVDFTATPNQAFLPGDVAFVWDFDDGTAPQSFEPGDPAYSNTLRYTFADGVDYFDVKVRAEDSRGFWAEKTLRITIADTLQDLIDEYGENSTIPVPSGTYAEDLKLWKGCTLAGAGPDSTILNGSIELYPGARVEGFTVRGGGGIFATSDAAALSGASEFYAEIEGNAVEGGSGYGIEIYPGETLPFTGFIKDNSITDNSFHGIYIHKLAGTVQDNEIRGENAVDDSYGITVTSSTVDCLIDSNIISGHRRSGIYIGSDFKGAMSNNEIYGNRGGLELSGTSAGSSIADNLIRDNIGFGGIFVEWGHRGSMARNTIRGNRNDSVGGGGVNLKWVYSGSSFTANTISDNVNASSYGGGGLHISAFYGGTVSSNIITQNSDIGTNSLNSNGGGANIQQFEAEAVFENNTLQGNSTLNGKGGGAYVQKLAGTFSGNTISGNSASRNGGGLYILGPATPAADPRIKDSNAISGNTLDSPESNAKADLRSPWADDLIPAN